MYRIIIGVWVLALMLSSWAGTIGGAGFVKRPDLAIFPSLEVSQSARGAGMGNAFASAKDVNAIFWNPAGLVGIKRLEASLSHSKWFVESTFSSGAIGFSKGLHAIGLSIMNFDPGPLEERTVQQPNGTGRMLSLGTVAVGAAYARRFTDKLSFGVRLMWARQDLDLIDYSTVNVDFGTQFDVGYQSIRLSMAMRNFGRDTQVTSRQFQQPLNFNLGGAAEIYGEKGDPFYVTGAFEMNFSFNLGERYHMGGEAWLMNVLALRAGYMSGYDAFGLTAGGGIVLPLGDRHISVDVAWQETAKGLEAPLRFSLNFGM